jgi:hypothetical protein
MLPLQFGYVKLFRTRAARLFAFGYVKENRLAKLHTFKASRLISSVLNNFVCARVRPYFSKKPYVRYPFILKCRSSYHSRSLSDLTVSFKFVIIRSHICRSLYNSLS